MNVDFTALYTDSNASSTIGVDNRRLRSERMAEDFGVRGRGGFYDQTGTIRDVVQNHLFQVLSNLTMEPPARLDSESVRDEKVKVLKAISPIEEKNLVRGQFLGYRDEPGVAKDSKTETFAALRLEINSWRWKGVPFYIRAGKCLPVTCTEIVARFHKPPALVPESALTENHMRLRLSPEVTIAMGMKILAGLFLILERHVETSEEPSPEELDKTLTAIWELRYQFRGIFKKSAAKLAKGMPHDPGGAPRRFPTEEERSRVCHEVAELHEQGKLLQAAFKLLAKKYKTSVRTIERTWRRRPKMKSD